MRLLLNLQLTLNPMIAIDLDQEFGRLETFNGISFIPSELRSLSGWFSCKSAKQQVEMGDGMMTMRSFYLTVLGLTVRSTSFAPVK